MHKLILMFFLTALSLVSAGQLRPPTGRDTLSAQCDKFMQTFANGNFSEAVQLLKLNSTLGNSFIDELDKTVKEQMVNILYSYKKITGFDLIEETDLKNVLVRRRYLLKFELYFLTFDFYMYNNGTKWMLSGFFYKDDQKELF